MIILVLVLFVLLLLISFPFHPLQDVGESSGSIHGQQGYYHSRLIWSICRLIIGSEYPVPVYHHNVQSLVIYLIKYISIPLMRYI